MLEELRAESLVLAGSVFCPFRQLVGIVDLLILEKMWRERRRWRNQGLPRCCPAVAFV